MMVERGVHVEHSTISRCSIRFLPLLEKVFRKHKGPVGRSWRMDETYIKIRGVWKYLYRAIDKEGNTIDFLLTAHGDAKAAGRFFQKAIKANGQPKKITLNKSGANKAAIDKLNEDLAPQQTILVRQIKCLNNLVEQDHRFIKRIVKPMMGFKSFRSAKAILAGVELMHMIGFVAEI